jgi:hypothetical protein
MASLVYFNDKVVSVVTGVAQCVYDALAEAPLGQPQRFCAMVPGEIAWDLCECGQLALSVTQVYPADNFGTPAAGARTTACGPKLTMISVNLTLVRCVPIPTDNGKPPTCDKLLTAAMNLEADRYLTRQAVSCCLKTLRDTYEIIDFSVDAATTVGPQGECAGFDMPFSFGLSSACCG